MLKGCLPRKSLTGAGTDVFFSAGSSNVRSWNRGVGPICSAGQWTNTFALTPQLVLVVGVGDELAPLT